MDREERREILSRDLENQNIKRIAERVKRGNYYKEGEYYNVVCGVLVLGGYCT